MSEWSKEPDLRSGSVSCVGSNPTQCTLGYVIVLPPRGVSWLILRELFFHSSVGQSIRLLIVGSEVRTLLEEKVVYIVFLYSRLYTFFVDPVSSVGRAHAFYIC